MSSFSKILLTVLLVLGTAYSAEAQFDRNLKTRDARFQNNMPLNIPTDENDTLFSDTTGWQPQGIEYHEDIPDTTLQHSVFQFRYDPYAVKIKVIDYPSLDPTGVQFVDELDAMNGNYYLNRGVMGQQHLALFHTFGDDLLWRMAPDLNSGYRKRPENIGFFQTRRPYSYLGYSSTLESERRLLVSHTQNILPRWNASFNYKLHNAEGNYSYSSLANHYIDATTNYYSRDARYQASAGFIWEKFRMDENGGLANDSIFINRTQTNEGGIPVRLSGMGSIDKNLTAFTKHTYNTVRPLEKYRRREEIKFVRCDTVADTVTEKVYHTDSSYVEVQKLEFREVMVYDTVVTYDTIAPLKPRVFNTGVFGFDFQYDKEKHVFADSTVTRVMKGDLYWTNDAYLDSRWRNPVKLLIGVRPLLMYSVMYNDFNAREFALVPNARLDIDTKIGSVSVVGEKSIGGQYFGGNYRLAGDLRVYLDTLHRHTLRADVAFQGQEPLLIYYTIDRMAGNSRKLGVTNIQKFEVRYTFRQWLDAAVTARHVVNNIWVEDSNRVVQNGGSAWLFQARLNATLHWSWFHYDMQHLFQYSTDQNQVRVPLFATKNSLYADIFVFKKALRMQVGVDIRYHTAFYADAYNPYLGVFYRQNSQKIGNYFLGDIFINLQVKRASIYAKVGHLNALWEMHPNYYLLPSYPANNFGFFYGMIWKFFD